MGLFDIFRGRVSRQAFIKLVIRAVRADGFDKPIREDTQLFGFYLEDTGHPQRCFLDNLYRDYLLSPRRERRALIERFVRGILHSPAIPEAWEKAKPLLRTRVRDRSFHSELVLRRQVGQMQSPEISWRSLTDHLVLELAIDHPDAIVTVSDDTLEKWGQTFDQAAIVGRENLWNASNEPFQRIGTYSYISTLRDTWDASRLFLHDLVWQCQVKGQHVAMVPERNVLLVSGSDDAEGLALIANLALEALKGGRPMSGYPVILDGTTWRTWNPPASHSAYPAMHRAMRMTDLINYGNQKSLLEKLCEKQGKDVFVATCSVVEQKDSGDYFSWATWTQSITSWLPVTDRIAFGAMGDNHQVKTMDIFDWQSVQMVCGHLLKLLEVYPLRYEVTAFPSPQDFIRLEEMARKTD